MYVRYIADGEVTTSFLSMLEIKDGSALDYQHRLGGLGSDRAAVIFRTKGWSCKTIDR